MPKPPTKNQLTLAWSPAFQTSATATFERLRGYTIPTAKLDQARALVRQWLVPVYNEAEARERLANLECELFLLGGEHAPPLTEAVTDVRAIFPAAALVAYGPKT